MVLGATGMSAQLTSDIVPRERQVPREEQVRRRDLENHIRLLRGQLRMANDQLQSLLTTLAAMAEMERMS